jgi:hypothetical protein
MTNPTHEVTAPSPTWIELESIVPLGGDESVTVEKITNLSVDTIKRRHSKFVVPVSDRRIGMKLRHALAIAARK